MIGFESSADQFLKAPLLFQRLVNINSRYLWIEARNKNALHISFLDTTG
jgi:hypothetical protein